MRALLAVLAALIGASAGAAGLGFLLAAIFVGLWGTFEGSAAMGGFFLGMPVGAILGAILGLWLVLRKKAPSNGRIAVWLAAAVVLLIAIGAYVWQTA
jgi:multisubunit Na+/H+ antiporter MnhE subunit